MIRKISAYLLATLFAGALTLPAFAGNDSEQHAFSTLDTNADGVISIEEAKVSEKLTEAWTHVDANQDGNLDSGEFSAFEAITE